MKLSGNTVLITGGTSGIGLALAERFIRHNNEVILCGRSEERLAATKGKLPTARIIRCDVGHEEERVALYEQVIREFPDLNIVINNAGIQQRMDLKTDDFAMCRDELAINLEAPIHLSLLFAKVIGQKENAHIVNVSSNLAFIPPVWVPVYGATKAGLHSFTFSLRVQLADAGIRVIEILPPAVNTNLGGPGKHTFGADVDVFADQVFQGLADDMDEIGYENNLDATRNQPRAELESLAVKRYAKMK